jgi:hypothetical protein
MKYVIWKNGAGAVEKYKEERTTSAVRRMRNRVKDV